MKITKEQKESIDFLKIFYNQRKFILITTVAAGMIAAITTSFIKPEYISTGTIFPTLNNSLEGTVENPSFGFDMEADRLIQILYSKEVQDTVVKRFDLINYFQIDTTNRLWKDELKKKFLKTVYFSRSAYLSVVISAQTKKPELSANVVNTMISMIDPIRNRMLKLNIEKATAILQKQYLEKKKTVDSLVNEISAIRAETGNPPISISHNQEFTFSNIEKMKNNNTKLEEKVNRYFAEEALMNDLKMRFEKAKDIYEQPVPAVYVLDLAVPSYKEFYPSYLMNILITATGTFLFLLMAVYIKERFQSLRKNFS